MPGDDCTLLAQCVEQTHHIANMMKLRVLVECIASGRLSKPPIAGATTRKPRLTIQRKSPVGNQEDVRRNVGLGVKPGNALIEHTISA